jgi:GxxExxY protein
MLRQSKYLAGAEVTPAADVPGDYPEKDLTRAIIGCAIEVHRRLGPGYLEAIYEVALAHELTKKGLACQRQRVVNVLYDGVVVGEHRIDIVVEDKVVLELKSVEQLTAKHVAQTISTLKAAGLRVALLLNFDEAKLVDGVRRVILSEHAASAASASLRPSSEV